MSFGYQVLGFGSGGGPGPYEMDYLVISGGGSGGSAGGSGGGGGGYRNSFDSETSGRNSSSRTAPTVDPGVLLTCTVGTGGAPTPGSSQDGNSGTDSEITGTGFVTINCTGGGAGRHTGAGGAGGC